MGILDKAIDIRYVIGIDLGTTQCALSYCDLKDKNLKIKSLPITQLVNDSMIDDLPTLPSTIYLSEENRVLNRPEWMERPGKIIGVYAKELGNQVPGRYVHSSKSWLCHPRAERQSPILPWQSEITDKKISPVDAACEYLTYLKNLWNAKIGIESEDSLFEKQKVIVTVPASFDPSARNLTLEAIEKAGIKNYSLLEEPQAAFYDYLQRNPTTMVSELKGVDTVLVIDVGGGTTDFSLIGVSWAKDSNHADFTRLAVGPHLLIGGDNIDLALARNAEMAFKQKGKKLNSKQWLSLLAQSHVIKEKLLSEESDEKVDFTITGSGSGVLSGSAKVQLKSKFIRQTLIDGFFPLVESNEYPDESEALGLSEAGLPFTKDAAVTKHLAAFLKDNDVMPDAVLFNGGTMKADCLRQRLCEVIGLWRGKEPKVLENPHPILAVAAGAAYYGVVGMGLGQKINSGNPVSIYLGIGNSSSSTVDRYVPEQLICILPKGSETETDYDLKGKTLGIDLSHDSAFYLFYTPLPPKAEEFGRTIRFNSKRYLPLPPCKLKAQTAKGERQVNLRIKLRETGYLQIFCDEVDGKLSQELRFDLGESEKKAENTTTTKRKVPLTNAQLKGISKLLDDAFAGNIEFNSLFKEFESLIGTARATWDAEMLRQLFDIFIERESDFRQSQASMTIWCRLLGYTLRPGYGVKDDSERVEKIWKMAFDSFDYDNVEFWAEWWGMFKRIAPGLSAERQIALKNKVLQLLFPSKKRDKKPRKIVQHERNQLWRLLGHLERLTVEEKKDLGNLILETPMSFGVDSVALSTLARLGARELVYAPDSLMVPPSVANDWAAKLLRKAMPGNSYLDTALREIGRKTGDRMVQIEDQLRSDILDIFKKKLKKKNFIKPLLKAVKLEENDLQEITGEVLPSGFVWVKDSD
jgi:molecular chaperone DnaK (HSP70)